MAFRAVAVGVVVGSLGTLGGAVGARSDRATRLISPGTANSAATFTGAAVDGSRVWFQTVEPLVPADTDTAIDVYERTIDGTLRIITGGTGNVTPFFGGASSDGARVWFTTTEQLLPADTDGGLDVYERATGGDLRLISGGTANTGAIFEGASDDGARVWFATDEQLDASDVDAATDIYERTASGELRLVSGGTGLHFPSFRGASSDGSRVWFQTDEQLVPADTDTNSDVYERTATNELRLISSGTDTGLAFFVGGANDGSRVWFETDEQLDAADTDSLSDIYERSSSNTLRLISAGTSDPLPIFRGSSSDGSRVWFQTTDQLVGADVDTATDVYERTSANALRLITGGTTDLSASFTGAATDGSRVWFETFEQLDPGDTDASVDVYERTSAGALRLITPGTADANALFSGASSDGSRVWFATPESLDPADTDAAFDVYERTSAGALRLVSRGTGESNAIFDAAAADGSRVVFRTAEALDAQDTDTSLDIYEARLVPTLVRRPVVSGFVSVGSRLACRATILNGDARTYVWLRDGRSVSRARSYRVRRGDLGRRMRCRIVVESAGASLTTTSSPRAIPPRFVVPRTRGGTLRSAIAALGNRGARTRVRRVAGRGVKRGLVLGTTPRAGTRHQNATRITILIRR